MDNDEAVRDFLGDRPEAEQLRAWRVTLEQRLRSLEQDLEKSGTAPLPALKTKIEQLKRQVAALREEEAITQFVEDSVRVTLAMGTASEGPDYLEE
jgi:polyhydroxyalkanoate synthesis regulator phasin